MTDKKDKKTPAKTEKKVEKAEKKVEKKAKEVVKTPVESEDEDMLRFLQCMECGIVVSVDESCGCEPDNLTCCGHTMTELQPSRVGFMYKCGKCGLRVIIEDECECDECDLVCCSRPMALCEE
jgi:hypothetical protein